MSAQGDTAEDPSPPDLITESIEAIPEDSKEVENLKTEDEKTPNEDAKPADEENSSKTAREEETLTSEESKAATEEKKTLNSEISAEKPDNIEESATVPVIGEEKNVTEKTDVENQVGVKDSSETDSPDKTNSSRSRELKSILALSKEAKLDTNLPAKRKESTRKRDFAKLHHFGLTGHNYTSKDSKVAKYPVTAEAELEEETFNKPNMSLESPRPAKRSRTVSRDSTSGTPSDDGKKNRKVGIEGVNILKPNKDMFCWRCHKDNVNIACETCPRSYHSKCLRQTLKNDKEHWPCPECVSILKAESTQTRSEAMKGMTLEHLCSLLKYALNRMIQCQGSEPFLHPVNEEEFPTYKKYIIQPMDLTKIEKNLKNNLYGSTQAFEADAKWILHNCIIFNSYQSKLTHTAKNIVRVCKQEMAEIELCPNCYLNANSKKNTWFVEVCPKPHILVWAKLKGFPYWPAKAMCTNAADNVDVRFFGAHDRAWVHYKDCYLYSEKDPNTFKQKRYDIEKCIEEVDVYIENLRTVYGEFRHAPYKTPLDPENELKQLQIFLPKYKNQKTYSTLLRKKMRESLGESPSTSKSVEMKESTDDDKEAVEDIKEENKEDNENKSEETGKASKTSGSKNADGSKNARGSKNFEGSKNAAGSKNGDGSFSSANSPQRDNTKMENDTTLEEGYGTDDNTGDDDIDLERRKAFVDPKHNDSSCCDESIEDEDDGDTQVPNNISVNSLFRRKETRIRGVLNATPEKNKILPRRSSETMETSKRHPADDSLEDTPQQKLPRRNSDLSTKSDSSRVSNLSDKINRIETFEKMEVTLGVDDVARVSISEDVACDSSSSSSDSSKSGSEKSIEIKRKPVQVDIDHAEFTISPSNKLKISEALIKRLSDSGDTDTPASTPSKAERVKKNLATANDSQSSQSSTTKSHTDILIEKFKDVVDLEVVNFNDPTLIEDVESPNKKPEDDSGKDEKNDGESPVKKKIVEDEIPDKDGKTEEKLAGKDTTKQTDDTEKSVAIEKQSSEENENEDHTSKTNKTENSKDAKNSQESRRKSALRKIKALMGNSVEDVKTQKKFELLLAGSSDESNSSTSDEDKVKELEIDKKRIFSIIHSSLNEEKDAKENDQSKENQNGESEEINTMNDDDKESEVQPDGIKLVIRRKDHGRDVSNKVDGGTKSADTSPIKKSDEKTEDSAQSKPNKNPMIKIKISDVKSLSAKKAKPEMIKTRRSMDETREKSVDTGIIPLKASISPSGNLNKEFRSYSNMKNKNKLLAVNNEADKSKSLWCKSVVESVVNQGKETNDSLSLLKKRKLSADETLSASPANKLVKLVAIESILGKDLKSKESDKVEQQKTPKATSQNQSDEVMEIKSEPDSDDDFLESENLEAKKKYLSALNISEKNNEGSKQNDNEIRTRARAGEKRERFKIVDNLTRVIDDVALNYSATHDGEELLRLTGEKSATSSNSNWLEGEITVKSFAKMAGNATTGTYNTQRARKSFPTPRSVPKQILPVSTGTNKKDGTGGGTSMVPHKDVVNTSDVCSTNNTGTQNIAAAGTTSPGTVGTTSVSTTMKTATTPTASAVANSGSVLTNHHHHHHHPSTMGDVINSGGAVTTGVVPHLVHTKPQDSIGGATSMSHVLLFPGPVHYGSPIVNSVLGMVSSPLQTQMPMIPSLTPTNPKSLLQPQQIEPMPPGKGLKPYTPPNVSQSQNYIPQSEGRGPCNRSSMTAGAPANAVGQPTNQLILNNLLNQQCPASCPPIPMVSNVNTVVSSGSGSAVCDQHQQQQQQLIIPGEANNYSNNGTVANTAARDRNLDEDLTLLNTIVPENVTRAVHELLVRPPPKLKPKPPGMLSAVFDDGIPSSAGEVTAKINSIAHRMNDYLRGMLIETLEELGRSANPEAKIISLQLEIDALKHKHNVEIQEMKKNMGTLLRDIQRSIEENRERILSEARAAWECETIKRVELAKSKQWCANCSKEAKFYCCWNTSYCDYPCQQKHWPQHMGKCTQNIEKSANTAPPSTSAPVTGQPVILRQAAAGPSKTSNSPRIITKPTKVYLNNKTGVIPPKTFKVGTFQRWQPHNGS